MESTSAQIICSMEYVSIIINKRKLMVFSNGDILYILKNGDLKLINTQYIKCNGIYYTRKYIIEFAFRIQPIQ